MALIEVLKWDAPPNVFAYRFPQCELTTKSQVVVYESQEAVFVKDGVFYEPLGPGRHVLDTQNYPFVTKFMKELVTGDASPFTAEVWFVNKAIPLNIKWGTATPIQVEDPKYRIMMPVRSYGQYGMQICDVPRFLASLVGRIPVFTVRTLSDYFKGIISTQVKDCIATYIIESGVSILQLGSRLAEISKFLQNELSSHVEEYGVRIVSFMVNSISADENDPAVAQLKRALAKKAEMDIMGYTYQQEKSFDVMGKAASNKGSGAAIMQTGMGLGIGMGVGAPMGVAAGAMAKNLQFGTVAGQIFCPSCGAAMATNANFCPACGQKRLTESVKCANCGNMLPSGAKFCPNCGKGL